MATGTVIKVIPTSSTNYIKFPDGTMYCWGLTQALTTVLQGFYVAYPTDFVSAPTLIATWSFGTGSNQPGDIGALKTSEVSASQFYVTIGGDLPSVMSGALKVSWLAIGRWK